MNDYRDSSGRRLTDYPRPSVAVDTAVLTLDERLGLVVLQVRRENRRGWGLPGTFLHEGRGSPTRSTGHCGTRPTCQVCIHASFTSSTTPTATIAAGCSPSLTSTSFNWIGWRAGSPT